MKAVIQRVSEASVSIDQKIKASIGIGYVILLGIDQSDNEDDVTYLSQKIVNLRIFGDEDGKMNLDLAAINGQILLISQFTLLANTKKGNRPSYTEAARPEVAIPLYQKMIDSLTFQTQKPIQTGTFGADMKVSLINDGPVTIILDSKNKI